jgi:hypothetical protein
MPMILTQRQKKTAAGGAGPEGGLVHRERAKGWDHLAISLMPQLSGKVNPCEASSLAGRPLGKQIIQPLAYLLQSLAPP